MHELSCARRPEYHAVKCEQCGKKVRKNEMDDHIATIHAAVQCELCQECVQQCELHYHMTQNCPLRQILCQFCQLPYNSGAIIEHENYCGSRTDRCDGCGLRIMLCEMNLHVKDCQNAVAKLQRLRSVQAELVAA